MARRMALAATVLLILAGLTGGMTKTKRATTGQGDANLWQNVVDRMRDGDGYYDAMEAALRTQGSYALRPFVNFRPPVLASFLALFPSNTIPRLVLVALSALVAVTWVVRLDGRIAKPAVAVLMLFSVFYAATPLAVVFQDTWAGLLIALALALHTRHWGWAILCGALALSIREHAAVFAAAMLVAAVMQHRRREASAWVLLLVTFAFYMLVHAWFVSSHIHADDPAKSWVAYGGWRFIVATGRWTLLSLLAPAQAAAFVVPLALLGLVSLPDSRPALVTGFYMATFMVVGTAQNWYWGLLYAPLLAVGLAQCASDAVQAVQSFVVRPRAALSAPQ